MQEGQQGAEPEILARQKSGLLAGTGTGTTSARVETSTSRMVEALYLQEKIGLQDEMAKKRFHTIMKF